MQKCLSDLACKRICRDFVHSQVDQTVKRRLAIPVRIIVVPGTRTAFRIPKSTAVYFSADSRVPDDTPTLLLCFVRAFWPSAGKSSADIDTCRGSSFAILHGMQVVKQYRQDAAGTVLAIIKQCVKGSTSILNILTEATHHQQRRYCCRTLGTNGYWAPNLGQAEA